MSLTQWPPAAPMATADADALTARHAELDRLEDCAIRQAMWCLTRLEGDLDARLNAATESVIWWGLILAPQRERLARDEQAARVRHIIAGLEVEAVARRRAERAACEGHIASETGEDHDYD